MVLTAEVRKQRLSELRQQEAHQQQKLHYRGENRVFDVHRIDLDWLIYNRHNGRLEAEMLTWEQENAASPEGYDENLHELIDGLLWKSHPTRNQQTLDDLEAKTQQRPGIVSLDGVVIDGNRRTMLLRRLEKKLKKKQYLDAIILPDAYDENQKEIVRLETQYQLGEDAKVEYGALQKYLHARRLNVDLGIDPEEIDKLMGVQAGKAQEYLDIMKLMDEYLEHVGCARLYTMLKDSDGTKEGMFVDLFHDLKRLQGSNHKVPWTFGDFELLQLKSVQFDYIRLDEFADAKKSYREISHQSKNRNFFGHKDIWEKFGARHTEKVDPVAIEMPTLEQYIEENPDHETKVHAARARDEEWRKAVGPAMKENFGKSSQTLTYRTQEFLPRELLERAFLALEKIDIEAPTFTADPDNEQLVRAINQKSFAMKKKFEKNGG